MAYLAELAPPLPTEDDDEEERRRKGLPPRLAAVEMPSVASQTEESPRLAVNPPASPLPSRVSSAASNLVAQGMPRPAVTPPSVDSLDLTSQGLPSEPIAPEPVSQQAAAPPEKPKLSLRMPVSVADQVGAAPDRNDPRYQYTGHGLGGRLKAGFQNLRYGPAGAPSGGGTPGENAGNALGALLGKFLTGAVSPSVVGENKYAHDLGMWQQRQEAMSKAATEEAQRAHMLEQATHRDPYTGEVDPYYQAIIGQKGALSQHYANMDQAAQVRAQAMLGRLDETSRRDLLKALATGVVKPSPELEQKMRQMGLEYVPPVGKGQLGMLHHRGVDSQGRVVDSYYTWDKATGFVKPMRVGEEGDTGALLPPLRADGMPAPQGQTGGQAFTLQGVPQKGAGDFGAFRSAQEMERSYKTDEAAFQAYQEHYHALEDQATKLEQQAASLDDYDPRKNSTETRASQARDKAIAAKKEWDTHRAQIQGRYPPGYVEMAPGQGGWWYIKSHPESQGKADYPLGPQVHKTGKLAGYTPLKPNLLLGPAGPPQ